ncbi:hypothetical protein D1825_14745 [Cellulomonas rhizosphaerae]|uniref:Uncharacterized protein n=1 Tax=Cellulomonas rhizosphaerae TaxID=2293719 RepID=A0A413RIJ3_9CELL|nr:hypothetical protein D1825_14745 [Cellulomonas rhizosphaerae]
MAWLTHPVTLVALAVLVLNDHVLKAAYGTWWTGKLSDVAWLVLAPPLLATVVALTARRRIGAGWSVAAAGAVFVVVKVTAFGAAAASAILSLVAGRSVVLADPTDLLALPALGLALLAAARGARAPKRQLALLVVLPAAVLATAATSSMGADGATHIGVVDGVLVVADAYSGDDFAGATWYRSSDGETWEAVPYSSDRADELAARFVAVDADREVQCSGDDCFRAGDGPGLEVEHSTDGGSTWSTEWSVSGAALQGLADRYEGDIPPLQTEGVAVLTTPDGFRVYAANDGDGLAVRDEAGTWQRIGFGYRGETSVVPLPGEPTVIDHPAPAALFVGLLAALVTLALGRPRTERSGGRTVGGRICAVAAALTLWAGAAVNDAAGVVAGQPFGADFILGAIGPFGLVIVLALATMVLLGVAAGLLRGTRGWLVAFAGVGVTLVVQLVSPWPLAALGAVAVVVGAVVVSRARTAAAVPA